MSNHTNLLVSVLCLFSFFTTTNGYRFPPVPIPAIKLGQIWYIQRVRYLELSPVRIFVCPQCPQLQNLFTSWFYHDDF